MCGLIVCKDGLLYFQAVTVSPNVTMRRSNERSDLGKRRSSDQGHADVIKRRSSGDGIQAELTISISMTRDDSTRSSLMTSESSDFLSPITESAETTVIEVIKEKEENTTRDTEISLNDHFYEVLEKEEDEDSKVDLTAGSDDTTMNTVIRCQGSQTDDQEKESRYDLSGTQT